MSRPKDIGTKAESALVRHALTLGIPAERRALAGSADQGDVWLHGGRGVIEVKSRAAAHSPGDVERWLGEAERECIAAMSAGAPVDWVALVVKRVGSGYGSVGAWHCYQRPADAAWLLTGREISDGTGWVLMTVDAALGRLRTRWGLL